MSETTCPDTIGKSCFARKNLSFIFIALLIILSFNFSIYAQGPGDPYNPMTAPGSRGIAQESHILYWENPSGIIYNEVYFSEDYSLVESLDLSVKILDGSPSIVYTSATLNVMGTLDLFKKYYWRVVEYGVSGLTPGPIWHFTSRVSHMYNVVFLDDFTNGLSNWTISNDEGTCVWEIHDSSEYSMPPTAQGNVLAADADECGVNSTTLTSATIDVYNEMGFGLAFIEIEWDNDWKVNNAQDEAYVEVSSDSGNNWDVIWSAIGISIRSSHEQAASNFGDIPENYLIKFRAVQPGLDWWWAIDNVQVKLVGILDSNLPPDHLYAQADSSQLQVNLNWDTGYFPFPPNEIYKLQRKIGLPTDSAKYITIAELSSSTLEYFDQDVEENGVYTYRIGSFTSIGSIWGNEATAYVGIINSVKDKLDLNTFLLEQNYPNPFNPETTIKYGIPIKTNVQLSIYNALGEMIKVLLDEEKTAGNYEVSFDASNLPSGVYFYKIQAGDYINTKKMILLK